MHYIKTFLVLCIFCIWLIPVECKIKRLGRYKAGITRIHNYYRQKENASNMKLMVWDSYLAKRAAQWSENCYWGHQKKGLGENLGYYWNSGTVKMADVIIKSIKAWYNEKFIWRWSTHCGAACHYTQMVWAKTSKIGCAYSICTNLRTTGTPIKNAHYLVCFYDPPGNYYGQYPYKYGNRCSKCSDGDICKQGLCSSSAPGSHAIYLPKVNGGG